MTKFFNKFKTPYFCSIFDPFPPPIFWARKKKKFPRKSGSITQNFIWVSNNMPKFRKTNDPVRRKRLDRRMD